jgi:hypothetical protein
MSDPIQIAAAAMYDTQCGEKFNVLYALCSDGTIWCLLPNKNQWKQLPPLQGPGPTRCAQL